MLESHWCCTRRKDYNIRTRIPPRLAKVISQQDQARASKSTPRRLLPPSQRALIVHNQTDDAAAERYDRSLTISDESYQQHETILTSMRQDMTACTVTDASSENFRNTGRSSEHIISLWVASKHSRIHQVEFRSLCQQSLQTCKLELLFDTKLAVQ